jgi:hypothetical protein
MNERALLVPFQLWISLSSHLWLAEWWYLELITMQSLKAACEEAEVSMQLLFKMQKRVETFQCWFVRKLAEVLVSYLTK